MAMQCPSCGSTHIQPMAVVHAGGTQQFHATHTAVTSDGQFVQGSSQGSQSTALAQHCAPPAPPSPLPFIGAYGMGGIIIYMSMTVCDLLARECVYVGMAGLRYNWKQAAVGIGTHRAGLAADEGLACPGQGLQCREAPVAAHVVLPCVWSGAPAGTDGSNGLP
jgi:hypothetical protein